MRRMKEAIPSAVAAAIAAEDAEQLALRDDIHAYYRQLAKRTWPRGATMRCRRCGNVVDRSVGEMAQLFGGVLPECCREPMGIGDGRELAEAAS